MPAHERALAGFTLGFVLWLAARREECFKAYNRVLKLSMSDKERALHIMGSMHEQTTAGAAFDKAVSRLQCNQDVRASPRCTTYQWLRQRLMRSVCLFH